MVDHRNIIAILRGITTQETLAACEALISAGITLIEIPLNSPEAFKSIGLAAQAFDGKAEIGAGTVLTVAEVDQLKSVGGRFVVSPNCDPEVIAHTRSTGMKSYPGVFTPSEAFAAIKAGASGLKMFPAEVLGPSGIKAMKAVLPPDMPVYAVGGAGPDNFAEYFAAGCSGFGLGSYIFKPGMSASDISAKASAAISAYDEGKSK